MVESYDRGPAYNYGRPDEVELRWGLTGPVGYQIGAIITYAGSIENYLERAIWRLSNYDPRGQRPPTDSLEVTKLIGELEAHVPNLSPELGILVAEWSKAARYAAILRNNIAHGIAGNYGGVTAYMRNAQWFGETRKRRFGDTWINQSTGDMVRGAFATLLRVVAMLASPEIPLSKIGTPEALKAVREARSMLAEFSNA